MEENKPKPYTIPEAQKKVVNNIKTYLSDMADAIRENEGSVIKIAMAEKNKKDQEEIYKEAKVLTKSKIFMIIGGVLLIVGAIFFSVYLLKQKNNTVVPDQNITKNLDAIVSYDTSSYTDISSIITIADLMNLLKKESAQKDTAQSIRSIFLTTQNNGQRALSTLNEFLPILNLSMPDSLLRSFTGKYMLGIYTSAETDANTGTNKPYVFLIFQIKDYNSSYAGMLYWEKTILDDMFTIFGIDVTGDNKQLLGKQFKDTLVNNKDTRVLLDKDGYGLLYYTFPDKENMIITNSEDAIKEINNRLITKKIKPL